MRRTSLFNLAIIRATAIGVGPSVVRKEHGAPRNAATYPTRLRHGGSAATRRLPALVRSAQKIDAAAGHLKQLLLFLTGTGAGMAEAIYLDWRDVDTTGAMAIGPAYEIRDSCGASILQTHLDSTLAPPPAKYGSSRRSTVVERAACHIGSGDLGRD